MSRPVRVRFAPSPTGHLHVGSARTALFNWLFARHEGGAFVLRIEDTDLARSTVESERAVLDDLAWLGLAWDEGPDVGGAYGPYRQSERLEIYREHAERLLAEGKAFRCYCTDEELEEKRRLALTDGRIPQYDGACRGLSAAAEAALSSEGRRPTVRAHRPTRDVAVDDLVRGRVEFAREMLGDFIILRSDGRPTYNFAVVVDDALMEISHVVRAEEHLPNTMRQLLLYEALGLEPPSFAHVSLIVDKDRSKLSKRRGASSVAEFREQGFLSEALLNYLALLGWSHPDAKEIMSRDELVRAFDLARVSSSPAAFDEDKLAWINAHHIREEPIGRVAELARPYFEAEGVCEPDGERFEAIVDLVREGLERLSEIPYAAGFFFTADPEVEDDARPWLESETGGAVLKGLLSTLEAEEGVLDQASVKRALKAVGEELGARGKDLYMPVRAALTGRIHGPSLALVAALLGRDRVLARLSRAAARR